MILYRDVTKNEFKKIVNCDKKIGRADYDGMHFFKYADHAKKYLHCFGEIILECDIPDYLIEEMDYVNFYPYNNFAVGVPIPEYVINKNNFDYVFVKSTDPDMRGNDSKLYGMFLNDMYNKWKKINKDYFNDKYGFYDYVVAYLKDKELDDVIDRYRSVKKRVMIK